MKRFYHIVEWSKLFGLLGIISASSDMVWVVCFAQKVCLASMHWCKLFEQSVLTIWSSYSSIGLYYFHEIEIFWRVLIEDHSITLYRNTVHSLHQFQKNKNEKLVRTLEYCASPGMPRQVCPVVNFAQKMLTFHKRW